MQRKSFAKDKCPVARSLDVLGDHWSLLILRDSLRGARRFSEFERSLGVAKNILTTRLRKLVAQGILRKVEGETAYAEYELTPKGEALRPVVRALWQWGAEHMYPPSKRPTEIKPLRAA